VNCVVWSLPKPVPDELTSEEEAAHKLTSFKIEGLKRNRFVVTLKLPLLAVELPTSGRCIAWLKMPGKQTTAEPEAVALRTKMMIQSVAHLIQYCRWIVDSS
jgi:hypothetical protein